MSISLKEMTKLVEEKDVSELVQDERVMEFVQEMDESATVILGRALEDDADRACMMISIIQSLVCLQLLREGDMEMLFTLLADQKTFGIIIAVSMKMGVGLAAMEEWH